jgi:hypothetical protein
MTATRNGRSWSAVDVLYRARNRGTRKFCRAHLVHRDCASAEFIESVNRLQMTFISEVEGGKCQTEGTCGYRLSVILSQWFVVASPTRPNQTVISQPYPTLPPTFRPSVTAISCDSSPLSYSSSRALHLISTFYPFFA